jgi:putative MFS transporter
MASASAVQEQEQEQDQSMEATSNPSTISWFASCIINYGSTERNNATVELASPGHHANGEEKPTSLLDIEDAMERLGMGRFQYEILWAAGLCFAADAMEVLLLSFLAVILQVEWGLQGHQMDTIISVVFAGAMLGTLVLSPLADVIGRRPVFTATAAIISVFGVGTAFCTSYEWLLVARFLVGFGVGGLTVPFDTLAEFVPTSHRGTKLLYIEFFWTAGTLLVPVFAWWALGNGNGDDDDTNDGSWQFFVILCAIPCILSTILGIILVPESPRWLLTKGKNEEALQILRKAARRNGLDPYETFPEGTRVVQAHEHNEDASLMDLVSPKWFKITMLLWGAWFGLAFLYYGVIIAISIVFTTHENKDENGDGGGYEFDYVAIFISASSEIVGLILVLMTVDKWGRIKTQTATYLLGGFGCLLLGFAAYADASRTVLVVLAFISRMAMMGASCTTWVSTSEILTTDIRGTGHGAANAIGRFGGFFCPYIISEGTSLRLIGILLFVVSVATAAISWQLPETAGKALGEANTFTESNKTAPADDQKTPYQIL